LFYKDGFGYVVQGPENEENGSGSGGAVDQYIENKHIKNDEDKGEEEAADNGGLVERRQFFDRGFHELVFEIVG
jgi:hypothetical protein